MEKLNIAEILKDCPKGMELDCTMWNNVVFDHIDTTSNYPIYIKKMGGELEYLTEDGHFNFDCDAKCVIFPKGKTTWEGFQRPFKDGDILVGKGNQPFIFKKLNNSHGCYSYCGIDLLDRFHLESDDWTFANSLRFATEEEKQKLFDAIKDNGYKWNPETKTLEKLVKPKFKVGDKIRHKETNKDDVYEISKVYDDSYGLVGFTWMIYMKYQDQFELVPDIKPKFKVGDRIKYINGKNKNGVKEGIILSITDDTYDIAVTNDMGIFVPIAEQDNWELVPNKFDTNTLKPFESRVLVRDYDHQCWRVSFFGYFDKFMGKFDTVRGVYIQCIPYEGNEYLLNTNKDCNEYFKTW